MAATMKSGVQFNWDVFPSTRLELSQLPTPIGCLYKPLFIPGTDYGASETSTFYSCSRCGAYMNPYIEIDEDRGVWKCQFCQQKSFLPQNFEITRDKPSLPFSHQTLPTDISNGLNDSSPECIAFIIDLYQHIDEVASEDDSEPETSFASLIDSIIQSLDNLKDDTLVCFVTFDASVHLHRIKESSEKVSFAIDELFKQDKYDIHSLCEDEKIQEQVIKRVTAKSKHLPQSYTESELYSNQMLTKLSSATRPVIKEFLRGLTPTFTNSFKPIRSLGLCLYLVSVLIIKLSYQAFTGKFLLFLSGPNTTEPGLIVDTNGNQVFRSHNDIKQLNDKQRNVNSASKFFKILSHVANGLSLANAYQIEIGLTKKLTDFDLNTLAPKWSVDIFTGSLDQVGLYEMKHLISNTNGNILILNSFSDLQFRTQLKKAIDTFTLSTSYHATLTVLTSPRLKIKSLIGHSYPLPSSFTDPQQHHDSISDQLSKFDSKYNTHHFTNKWFWNSISAEDTLSLFFEIDGLRSFKEQGSSSMHVQFQFKYWDPREKKWKLNIHTLKRRTTMAIVNRKNDLDLNLINSKIELLQSFNSSCWSILLARLMINKLDTNIGFDFEGIVEQIDSVTIKLLNNFNRLIVENYTISEKLRDLPSLVYHLRRNPQLINIFNSSPDETTFYHHWFLKMGLEAAEIIEPRLYCLENGPLPESISEAKTFPLDSDVLARVPNKATLVLDSQFAILVYYNVTSPADKFKLHPSHNEKIYETEEVFANARQFLSSYLKVEHRVLAPKYIITQTNHSQARFLISRLNPVEIAPYAALEEEEKPSWFSSLFTNSKPKKVATNILSDEVGFDTYYKDLIQKVKDYRIEDGY